MNPDDTTSTIPDPCTPKTETASSSFTDRRIPEALRAMSAALEPLAERVRAFLDVETQILESQPAAPPDRIYCTKCRKWRRPQPAHHGWASCPRCGTKVKVG